MEYVNTIIGFLGGVFSLDEGFSPLSLISLISLGAIFFIFALESFFYLIKSPKGFSNLVLVIGILGMFVALYFSLTDAQEVDTKALSDSLLSSVFIGIIGAIFSVILHFFEALYYSNIDPARSVNNSVKELVRFVKNDMGTVQKNLSTHLQKQTELYAQQIRQAETNQELTKGKSELHHISQQIYDLTQHLKQELDESRQNSDANTKRLIENISELVNELNKQNSSVLGPKIMAKTSLKAPSNNDPNILNRQPS